MVLPSRLDPTLRSLHGVRVVFNYGEDDPVADVSRSRRLAAAIGASVIVVRGGHNALLEHPDEVGRAVRRAIDSLTPTDA